MKVGDDDCHGDNGDGYDDCHGDNDDGDDDCHGDNGDGDDDCHGDNGDNHHGDGDHVLNNHINLSHQLCSAL